VPLHAVGSPTGAKARAAVARIPSRPLPRNRPVWEMIVLHGLPGGRLMIVNRAHYAMVDGLAHRDIMTTMFDDSPEGTAVEGNQISGDSRKPEETPNSPGVGPPSASLRRPDSAVSYGHIHREGEGER
jgi:hypothetical protein